MFSSMSIIRKRAGCVVTDLSGPRIAPRFGWLLGARETGLLVSGFD